MRPPARPRQRTRREHSADLERGREAYARRSWAQAFEAFSAAEAAGPLGVADLECQAWSAVLLGRDDAFLAILERLHDLCAEAGDASGAARAAFWHGMRLFALGEAGRASGWLARAERAIEGRDDPVRGWLAIPTVFRLLRPGGDFNAGFAKAVEAAEVGERFRDRDLVAMARCQQGVARLRQGRVRDGLALLDESMLAATASDLNPLVTGLVYCTLIASCHRVWALDRAREWTDVLTRWCQSQPELVTFTGTCLVHRAEILQLHGDWREALEEMDRISPRDGEARPEGLYQQGEIYRLRGAHAKAEESYLEASRLGREPQPGLALLRLAQGKTDAAVSAIRRVLQAISDPQQRTRHLPACVEIMLAAGAVDEAKAAANELEQMSSSTDSPVLGAIADHARGAVLLAEGNAREALPALRRSFALWSEVGAPYLAARVRVLAGRACRELGDEEGARLESDAARAIFEKLGAAPDLSALEAQPARRQGALTARELHVLRLVAGGGTNKAIARELGLSEKTVDRHLSNIFTKLGVSSRAAATAYAYQHALI